MGGLALLVFGLGAFLLMVGATRLAQRLMLGGAVLALIGVCTPTLSTATPELARVLGILVLIVSIIALGAGIVGYLSGRRRLKAFFAGSPTSRKRRVDRDA